MSLLQYIPDSPVAASPSFHFCQRHARELLGNLLKAPNDPVALHKVYLLSSISASKTLTRI